MYLTVMIRIPKLVVLDRLNIIMVSIARACSLFRLSRNILVPIMRTCSFLVSIACACSLFRLPLNILVSITRGCSLFCLRRSIWTLDHSCMYLLSAYVSPIHYITL